MLYRAKQSELSFISFLIVHKRRRSLYPLDSNETDIDAEQRIQDSFADIGADEAPLTITRTILGISKNEFEFISSEVAPNPEAQKLSIANAGFSEMQWTISGIEPWLSVEPDNGRCICDSNEVILDVNLSGLTPANIRAD